MERERSNVGTFCFKYEELPERQNHQKEQEEQKSPTLSLKAEMRTGGTESRSSLAELHRTKLNYSQEDIHALASKAELLVLTGSNHDLRKSSSDDDDDDKEREEESDCIPDDNDTPDLDIIDTNYEEPCLSGTWEHDIQEQYLSEGSALGTWDNSMKSVLCFGEDYSNYIRRRSELPSIDIISSNTEQCGLQNSPRDMRTGGLDPVLVLRRSERNWLNVLTELNTEVNQAAFGEIEHFQRLMATCETNIETLSTIKISADVVPKCLPQDHNDLLATWEELLQELNERLSLCENFRNLNVEIETAASKLDILLKRRRKLESSDDEDIDLRKDSFQGLLQHLQLLRESFSETNHNLQNIQNKINNDGKNVQKVSLLCFCKQEITSMIGRIEENTEQITEQIKECDKSIKEKLYLDQELLVIDQHFNKSKWRRREISMSAEIEDLNEEKVAFLQKLLSDLKSKHAVTKEYFEKSSKSLERVRKYLTRTEESGGTGEGKGFLLSCMPVVVVTSALMVYNYISPVGFLSRFCRQNVYDN